MFSMTLKDGRSLHYRFQSRRDRNDKDIWHVRFRYKPTLPGPFTDAEKSTGESSFKAAQSVASKIIQKYHEQKETKARHLSAGVAICWGKVREDAFSKVTVQLLEGKTWKDHALCSVLTFLRPRASHTWSR